MSDHSSSDLAVEIPQVLSAAMAAGVYICIAQRTGAYFLSGTKYDVINCLSGFVTLIVIGAWNAKNFVDDFKAFANRNDDGFSLGPTVIFGAATFTTLGVAATLLFDGFKAIYALSIFFFLCSAWSTTSWNRRRKKDPSDPEVPKRRKRVFWYSFCGLALAGAAVMGWLTLLIGAFLFVLVIFIMDAREYQTFSSAMRRAQA